MGSDNPAAFGPEVSSFHGIVIAVRREEISDLAFSQKMIVSRSSKYKKGDFTKLVFGVLCTRIRTSGFLLKIGPS